MLSFLMLVLKILSNRGIDMFNYKYLSDMTHWLYSDDAKGFMVKAKKEIKVGEEVRIGCFIVDLCVLWK